MISCPFFLLLFLSLSLSICSWGGVGGLLSLLSLSSLFLLFFVCFRELPIPYWGGFGGGFHYISHIGLCYGELGYVKKPN